MRQDQYEYTLAELEGDLGVVAQQARDPITDHTVRMMQMGIAICERLERIIDTLEQKE